MSFTISETIPTSRLRRLISERLGNSYREAIHVPLHRDVDVSNLLDQLRDRPEGSHPFNFTDALLAATVESLRRNPTFNAVYADEGLTVVEEVNLGFAVDTPQGLLVPVLKQAEILSRDDLAKRRRELTAAVVQKRHTLDDLSECTFTVSNLGTFGVDSFDPIINPPQVAILGIGRVREQVVVGREGRFKIGNIVGLSLVFDHRFHDGGSAATMLSAIVERLELGWP